MSQAQREKALASIELQQSDIDLVALEFELDKAKAEKILRENKGDVASTFRQLLRQ